MDSFTLQMHDKFTPGTLLLIFPCILLFCNQGLCVIVDHADNLHDDGKIQAKQMQVEDNGCIVPPRKQALTHVLGTQIVLPERKAHEVESTVCLTGYIDLTLCHLHDAIWRQARSPLQVVIIKVQTVYQGKLPPRNQYLKKPCG